MFLTCDRHVKSKHVLARHACGGRGQACGSQCDNTSSGRIGGACRAHAACSLVSSKTDSPLVLEGQGLHAATYSSRCLSVLSQQADRHPKLCLPYHDPAYGSQQPAPTAPEPCRDTKERSIVGRVPRLLPPQTAHNHPQFVAMRNHGPRLTGQPTASFPQALTLHWEGNAPVGNTNETHNADM
jgi:hypothetical protein